MKMDTISYTLHTILRPYLFSVSTARKNTKKLTIEDEFVNSLTLHNEPTYRRRLPNFH